MTSLMEALEDLGELMADNLVTQGVTDADPSDGLTTLANKILDITPGPTPTPASISLTADKSILSYYDSESATLSATVLDSSSNPLEGQTVEFFKGSTSLGTAQTNSSGVATKSYSSAGSGDVSFTAGVGSLFSETYAIEDCIFFDATETTKGTASSAVTGDVYNSLSIPTLPNHFVWEIDMKVSSTSGSEDRMFFTPTAMSGEQPPNALWVEFSSSSTGMVIGSRRSSNTYNTGSGKSYSANTYYHFKVERNGNTITGYVDDSNRGTLTESWIDNYSSWWFSYALWKRPNISLTWKNIKLKPL